MTCFGFVSGLISTVFSDGFACCLGVFGVFVFCVVWFLGAESRKQICYESSIIIKILYVINLK
jgi:hypothetical protein